MARGLNTKKALLTPKLSQIMVQTGEQIRLARLRRKLSVEIVSQRAGISRATLWKIEKGEPTVAIGLYLKVLHAINLEKDMLKIAADDELGRFLEDAKLQSRYKRGEQK